MSLEARIERTQDGRARVFLTGNIDERANIPDTLATIREDAVLNLSGIEHVNSIGLLHWLNAISALTSRHRVVIEALSYRLSIQANNIADLFGDAEILSAMAPYFCATCNANREVEIRRDDVRRPNSPVPSPACPTCKSPMALDELEEYFNFLREPLRS